ncbi:hypothetical protein ES703_117580 [subsurface metagenome]
MTIDEAIKELTRYINEPYSKLHPYFSEATKLGIEGLDRIIYQRKMKDPGYSVPLPGEDPEDPGGELAILSSEKVKP